MTFSERFESTFRRLLPAPFTIAILLTLLTFLLALVFTESKVEDGFYPLEIIGFWEKGLWNPPLLVFAFQMMLILVLGHTLALSPFVDSIINKLTDLASTQSRAAWLVTFSTMLVAFFNWGLGLIFGAIIARKVGEAFDRRGEKLNYALIGACGYSGFMVWHGGISGSAPAKVVEPNHMQSLMQGMYNPTQLASLPESIPFNLTIFSSMNVAVSIAILLVIPLLASFLGKRKNSDQKLPIAVKPTEKSVEKRIGAERLDHSKLLCYSLGGALLLYCFYIPLSQTEFSFNFFGINYINLLLLSMALVAHGSFSSFLKAIDSAIGGASGILIQFPLYFGILGIMKHSGLINLISDFFTSISNQQSFPIFTFFSAGLVNFFVPSGGGQWSIQGPIIVQAAQELKVPLSKGIMAMAYGDQLTNMLQPFWALPLLGITGLKARDILPYTLVLMLAGMLIFLIGLLLF